MFPRIGDSTTQGARAMTMHFGSLRTHQDSRRIRFLPSLNAVILFVLMVFPAIAIAQTKKPNILVIFGDDIGQSQISAYTMGLMGYRTPNIDRIAREGAIFTDAYGQQSCTAGRASF